MTLLVFDLSLWPNRVSSLMMVRPSHISSTQTLYLSLSDFAEQLFHSGPMVLDEGLSAACSILANSENMALLTLFPMSLSKSTDHVTMKNRRLLEDKIVAHLA